MKRILIYAGVFLAVFIVALTAFFPLSVVVSKFVNRAIVANRVTVSYSEIDSTVFRTIIKDVSTEEKDQNIELGDIVVKYSPLSAITQKARVVADTPYGKAEILHKKGRIQANALVDAARVARLFGETATGELALVLHYDYKTGSGNFNLNSGPFSVQIPLMKVTGESITGGGTIADNIFLINSIETTGQANLKMTGQIKLDTVNINRSVINITGEGTMMGLSTKFAIRGPLSAPQFVLQ